MITQAIVQGIMAIPYGLAQLFPAWTPPAGLTDTVENGLPSLMVGADSLADWIPFSVIAGVLTAYLAAVLVAFGIKIVRIIASFLTGGGGSAA